MKKVLFSIFTFIALFFFTQKAVAQTQLKVGVFDIDLMVQHMPDYKIVDSLVQVYNTDSLGAEYQIYQNEFQRLDSTFKADSAAGKSAASGRTGRTALFARCRATSKTPTRARRAGAHPRRA